MTGKRERKQSVASTLAIDSEVFSALGEAEIHKQLQAFSRSTRVVVDPAGQRLLLRGADLAHHSADPYLNDYLHTLAVKVRHNDCANFYVRLADYDLCMEDSWTGYFVAQLLAERATKDPLVFVHLDDHTDMMSTLLIKTSEGLQDPGVGNRFDPVAPKDWEFAIGTGAIGIGSFVTALYYLPQPVHVIHINHMPDEHYLVYPGAIIHPLLPRVGFATLHRQPEESAKLLGTYTGGSDPMYLLSSIPQGRVIVHIDLDYFINDYNGNIGTTPARSVGELRERASVLMRAFFDGIRDIGIIVDRWIIATSPGFCCARHWRWLLDELSTRIKAVT